MLTNRKYPVAAVALAALAFLSACSSGGHQSATNTTASATTAPRSTPIAAPRETRALRPCPTQNVSLRVRTLNASTPGLTRTMVPIAAQTVRICVYFPAGNLGQDGLLSGAAATRLEVETNRLPTMKVPPNTPNCGIDACGMSLTFANGAHRVVVYEGFGPTPHPSGNTEASNGELASLPTTAWLQHVRADTHTTK